MLTNIFSQLIWIRKTSCEISLLLFLFYWPITNMIWAIVICMAWLGIAFDLFPLLMISYLLSAIGTIVISVILYIVYYLSIISSIASLRFYPALLSVVSWLSMNKIIPCGHIGGSATVICNSSEILDWIHPLYFSTLALLVFALYVINVQNN